MEKGKRYTLVLRAGRIVEVRLSPEGPWLYDPDEEAVVPAMLPPLGMIPIHEAHRMLMDAVAQAIKPFVKIMATIPSIPVYVATPPDQSRIEELSKKLDTAEFIVLGRDEEIRRLNDKRVKRENQAASLQKKVGFLENQVTDLDAALQEKKKTIRELERYAADLVERTRVAERTRVLGPGPNG